MERKREKLEPRSITLYPLDWATATQVAKDFGLGSVSAGLRFIVRDWLRLKRQSSDKEAGNGHDQS